MALTPNTGVCFSSVTVSAASPTPTPTAPVSDFTARHRLGRRLADQPRHHRVDRRSGAFNVEGTHIYAKPGRFATTINVTDVGGSAVTLTGTATVTDLAVTGSTGNFTAVEGQNTGTFVLATFTDPNTLATVADVNAPACRRRLGRRHADQRGHQRSSFSRSASRR